MHASFTHSSKIEHQTYLKVNLFYSLNGNLLNSISILQSFFMSRVEVSRLCIYFFTGMIIVTDRFHGQQAHKTCPASFKLDYWDSNIKVRQWASTYSLNSSTAKQLNSKLHNLDKHIRCA